MILWSTVILEKLTAAQLIKNFPAFYGTSRFTTVVTGPSPLDFSLSELNL
jgi:hypothetical protein